MISRIRAFILLPFIVMSTASHICLADSADLPAERILKRLSYQLSGGPPSLEDKEKLSSQANLEEQRKFLNLKIDEYLNSPLFEDTLDRKLSDLFFLNPLDPFAGGTNLYINSNSLNLLFKQIAKENQPWTSVFIGKKYSVLPKEVVPALERDWQFFQYVGPNDSPLSGIFEFSSTDSRVAGAFTTERFQRRYVSTELNKNRRRAATVFRIGLCDPMKAAISISEDREDELFDLVFDHLHETEPGQDLEEMLQQDAHGKDPACMACHYKLDPMGKTFRGLNHSLSPRPWGGALSYTDSSGQRVFLPGEGIGDVMRSLTEQEDFWTCQAERLSKWVFGEDKYVTKARANEIKEKIRSEGRGVKDIFRYLVTQPEFVTLQELTEAQKLGLHARELLRRCDSCHSNSSLGPPPLSEWPIGGSAAVMKRWLKRIDRVLDLENEGVGARMPPASAGWKIDRDGAKKLKAWMEMGSPDETGTPILGEAE